jgi:hypothetical protein
MLLTAIAATDEFLRAKPARQFTIEVIVNLRRTGIADNEH